MGNDVAYQNKDITQKVFAETFKDKSLKVYGLDVPRIIKTMPTNLPEIAANELRIDNLFLLEDGSVAIIDYESDYREANKLKYLNYITRVLIRYQKEGLSDIHIRMIVIYTADVNPGKVSDCCDAGAVTIKTESAFLSQLDSEEIMGRIRKKVEFGGELSEEEVMEFIVLPLTYRTKEKKEQALEEVISLAKQIEDEYTMAFVLAGIVVFADKIIDKETGKAVRRWISMTIVGRIIEEEKLEYADQYADQKVSETNEAIVKRMLKRGDTILRIKEVVDIPLEQIKEIEKSMQILA